MKGRGKKSLESIVHEHGKDRHVNHFDPIDIISHHIVFVLFLSLMFLFVAFIFINADFSQQTTPVTGFAIYEFKPITFHKEIASSVDDFLSDLRNSESRPLVFLTLCTFWIIIFGLVNMVMYEREVHNRHKK